MEEIVDGGAARVESDAPGLRGFEKFLTAGQVIVKLHIQAELHLLSVCKFRQYLILKSLLVLYY